MAGKQELIHVVAFDNIDMAMMLHSNVLTPGFNVYDDGMSFEGDNLRGKGGTRMRAIQRCQCFERGNTRFYGYKCKS